MAQSAIPFQLSHCSDIPKDEVEQLPSSHILSTPLAHERRPFRIDENVLNTRTVRQPCSRLRYHIEIC
jgi:hypothetical protein